MTLALIVLPIFLGAVAALAEPWPWRDRVMGALGVTLFGWAIAGVLVVTGG